MLEAIGAFIISPTGATLVAAALYFIYKTLILRVPEYVLDVYASRNGVPASDTVANSMKELIQVVHSELEQNDQLHEKTETPKEEVSTEDET